MAKALTPWLAAGAMLVSFTASAGYAPDQLPLNNEVSYAAAFPEEAQPPAVTQPWIGMFAADGLPDDVDWMSRSELAGTLVAPIAPRTRPLPHIVYQRSMPVLMTSFDGVAYTYEGYMPPVFLQTPRRDGATATSAGISAGTKTVGSSPSSSSSTSPSLLGAITARSPDGATPSVPRAAALASATPAPVEPEIVAMPHMPLPAGRDIANASYAGGGPQFIARPDYASLIDPDHMAREQKCLAEAIYFEARSEPEEGQAAVAQVVLNRMKSGLYPSNVCSVVYQNRNRYLGCQFSFACEGKSLRVTEPEPWHVAVRIAKEVTEGKTYLSGVGGATHYHANYVRPGWSSRLKKMEKIGTHIFYSLRPGQV